MIAKPTTKMEKGQQTLPRMIERQSAPLGPSIESHQSTIQQPFQSEGNIQSFTTNASDDLESIFSADDTDGPSSNETSFASADSNVDDRRQTKMSGTQYSGETELIEAYHCDVNLQRSMTESDMRSTPSTCAEVLENLHVNGPFKLTPCPLHPNLPFWYSFDLYRLSQSLGLDVGALCKRIQKSYQKEHVSAEEFWREVEAIHKEFKNDMQSAKKHKPMMPAKSSIPDWTSANHNYYCDEISGDSLSFGAELDFSEKPDSHLFDFRLKPIKHERSCRFHRRFGADRFLTIDMPCFGSKQLPSLPKTLSQKQHDGRSMHVSVFDWLMNNDLYIAGRKWRAFYVEAIKISGKKKRKAMKPRQRLHLFAIDGFDFNRPGEGQAGRHDPMELLDFVQWHLPIESNKESTDVKLFARFQLGLSKTFATVVLEPEEFIQADDIRAQDENGNIVPDGPIMTDGCGRISYMLARDIWAYYGKPGQDVPSAFQARIGGAKGLWHVDYTNAHPDVGKRGYWIEVRDSQLKIKPHPAHRKNADKFQRTFEVVKYSSGCDPGHLNVQLINIMHHCQVPKSRFREVLHDDIGEYLGSLNKSIDDPHLLRVWSQTHHRPSSDTIEFCGGMPNQREEELNCLLESGFRAESCWYLNECVKGLLKQELDAYVEKLRIKVEASTSVFCIPDPLGILAPGEVQLNFSKPKINPLTGLLEMELESPKVLVGRNPAHLASDIQAVKAVHHRELRHLKDVIIFPVRGQFPLADWLSGGDYDGDTVSVIWDPRLTEKFQNHSKPKLATKAECGITSQTRLVSTIFKTPQPTPHQLTSFLLACCSFNGRQSLLGQVTVEHESLVYANISNLGKPGAKILAALAGYLVDAAKQGDSFDDSAWNNLKKRVRMMCGIKRQKDPAYKEGGREGAARRDGESINIIDHLIFDVAEKLRDTELKQFHDNWTSKAATFDIDLKRIFDEEKDRAKKLPLVERRALNAVLEDLRKEVQKVREEWQRALGRDDDPISRIESGTTAGRNNFRQVVQELMDQVSKIEPLDVGCDIRREFERDGGGRGSRWSLLRASCLYGLCYRSRSTMLWKLVGDELCKIKARAHARAHSCGRTWEMTLEARQIMKADIKKVKRLYEDDADYDTDTAGD